jgi:colanic acid/amylovoran biosynthesis protein
MIRVVISNVFGSFNRGDALLVEALHDSLREAFGEAAVLDGIAHFPELERAHLPDVTWHRPPGRSYASNGLLRKLTNAWRITMVGLYALLGAPRWFPPLAPRDQLSGVKAIKDSDLVVSCAGGFLIDTNLSILGNLSQLAMAHRFGRPVILAPQTIGPIRRKWIRPLARWVLNRCTVICTREDYSYRFLIELGVKPEKIRELTDLALYHRRADPAAGDAALAELGFTPGERFIGASVVNWSFPRSNDAAASKALYFDQICWLIREVHARTGMRVLLVNQVSSDLVLGRRVAAAVGEAAVIDEKDRTPAQMRGMITRSQAFVGSRFHSCVFALLERIPTIALAYSYKSNGIMEALGLGDRVFDIDGFPKEQVMTVVDTLLADGPAESARIEHGVQSLDMPTFAAVLRDWEAGSKRGGISTS